MSKQAISYSGNPIVTASFTLLAGGLIMALAIGPRIPRDLRMSPRRGLAFVLAGGVTQAYKAPGFPTTSRIIDAFQPPDGVVSVGGYESIRIRVGQHPASGIVGLRNFEGPHFGGTEGLGGLGWELIEGRIVFELGASTERVLTLHKIAGAWVVFYEFRSLNPASVGWGVVAAVGIEGDFEQDGDKPAESDPALRERVIAVLNEVGDRTTEELVDLFAPT